MVKVNQTPELPSGAAVAKTRTITRRKVGIKEKRRTTSGIITIIKVGSEVMARATTLEAGSEAPPTPKVGLETQTLAQEDSQANPQGLAKAQTPEVLGLSKSNTENFLIP